MSHVAYALKLRDGHAMHVAFAWGRPHFGPCRSRLCSILAGCRARGCVPVAEAGTSQPCCWKEVDDQTLLTAVEDARRTKRELGKPVLQPGVIFHPKFSPAAPVAHSGDPARPQIVALLAASVDFASLYRQCGQRLEGCGQAAIHMRSGGVVAVELNAGAPYQGRQYYDSSAPECANQSDGALHILGKEGLSPLLHDPNLSALECRCRIQGEPRRCRVWQPGTLPATN